MIDAVDFYEVNSWQNGQHCDLRLEKVLAASIDLHRITFGKQEGVPGWVVTQRRPL